MIRKVHKTRSKRLYIAGVASLLVLVFVILELTNTLHFFRHSTPQPTGPVTKGEVSNAANKLASPSNASSPSASSTNQKTQAATTAPAAMPTTPTGEFVSNHHPNLSGQPAPNTMTSNCTTTPGASCQITFTMGSDTKSLPVKSTDTQGSVYWSWTLQSVGLTKGTWTVQAIASNSIGTKISIDAQGLVVGS